MLPCHCIFNGLLDNVSGSGNESPISLISWVANSSLNVGTQGQREARLNQGGYPDLVVVLRFCEEAVQRRKQMSVSV